MVAAAGAVDAAAGGDVVDCAVQGEIDGEIGVGSIVQVELGVGQVDRSLLSDSHVRDGSVWKCREGGSRRRD